MNSKLNGEDPQNNINNYIHNLDVANVLSAELLDNNSSSYIDPNIAGHESYSKGDADGEENGVNNGNGDQLDDVNPYGVPGVPPLPEGVDPKKMCPFCQKTFSHPGSMGRHLDLKKGTKQHPLELINKMRSDVKRRGDIEKIKERRKLRAKRYYSKLEVKERTKVQRRGRDKLLRAKKLFINSFYEKLGKPELDENPTFPRLVFYFLPPNQWPNDPPTLETYRLLCNVLNEKFLPNEEENAKIYFEIMQKLHSASENWLVLSDNVKQDIWIRELRQSAADAMMNNSLYDLRHRDEWVLKSAKERIQNGSNDGEDDEDDDEEEEDGNESEHDQDNEIHKNEQQIPQTQVPSDVPVQQEEEEVNEENYYNEQELAAVAEAVVNNSKDTESHLDPQLIK